MKSSLSLRLLAAAAVSTLIALVATAFVLNSLFRVYFEDRVQSELNSWVVALTNQTQLDVDGTVLVAELSDPRFAQPLSGYYWQVIPENAQPVLSASFWAQPLDVTVPDQRGVITYSDVTGSDGGTYLAGSWRITLGQNDAEQEIIITVAVDRMSVDVPVSRFAQNVAIAMAVLGVFLVIASWFTVRIGLKPLKTVRSEVNFVKTNPKSRLSTDCAIEVAPLVKEVNDLLDQQEKNVEAARARASTLAHGLKTPLTVMRALAEDLRTSGGAASIPDEIDFQVSSMQHLVERELARTRDQLNSHVMRCEARPVVEKLVNAFQRRAGGEEIEWQIDIPSKMQCPFDEFALTELLGNLIDNATKWTTDRIVISGRNSPDEAFLQVSDNGSGIHEDHLEKVLRRGEHLNRDAAGDGLGLSIVQDMLAQRDIDLSLVNCKEGGLAVRIDWSRHNEVVKPAI